MLKLTLVGGPTALVEYAGGLIRTTGPAIRSDAVGRVDVVLLSQEHHSDNPRPGGARVPARRRTRPHHGPGGRAPGCNVLGLEPWSSVEVERDGSGPVRVTAVPAQHGPDGTDHITGPVIGFVLEADGEDKVYVSGDSASLDVVRTISDRVGDLDVAILFAGGETVSA